MHFACAALDQAPMEWSVLVRDVDSGDVLLDYQGGKVLDTASVGKLIMLAFVGNVLLENPASGAVRLDRRSVAPVSDSGIWRHLGIDQLGVADLARLVFLSSDNLATNVLLDHFGLDRIRAFRPALGLDQTDLFDIVRDNRQDWNPEALSRAPAVELCDFMTRIVQHRVVSPALSDWLWRGLSLCMDLTMVPGPLGLDPLAHAVGGDVLPVVANKTGTDAGVRADAGIIRLGSRVFTYAAVCNYDENGTKDVEVLKLMHSIGEVIMEASAKP